MARGDSGESVLTRVMRILESFGSDRPELTISELADRAELPLSTAHRLTMSMVEHGMLDRYESGLVGMGSQMWELTTRCSRVRLRDASRPVLESLHVAVGQHVQLAVLVNDQVLFIERLSSRTVVPNVAKVATRLPPYACSAGLVFLAFGRESFRTTVFAAELTRFTQHSITDVARLRREVASTRRQGYSVAVQLINIGSKGVAVPIAGVGGDVIAALSIVGPHTTDHLPWIRLLTEGAREISQTLGAWNAG